MKTHAGKNQGNNNKTVSNGSFVRQNSNEPVSRFADNRPEAIAGKKLQEEMSNSPRVKQLRAIQEMADHSPKAQQAAQLQAVANHYAMRTAQRSVLRKEDKEGEIPLQGKFGTIQKKPEKNNTGLPDNLKRGIENLSGHSMDDVKVHYNSGKPAQLNAHAYAQGTDIHLASGQEKHLPHEAWHVIQQKQGRVKPTKQLKGKISVNDDGGLEKEAREMGVKEENFRFSAQEFKHQPVPAGATAPIQRYTGYEVEARIPIYGDYFGGEGYIRKEYVDGFTKELGYFIFGGLEYGPVYGADPMGHFTISADHNEIQAAHRNLFDLLTLSGFLDPGISPRTMSSIEYITPPRDETGKSGKALMQDDIKAIQSHAGETLKQALSDSISPLKYTNDHILTGIPEKDFFSWVEKHNGNKELFGGALNKLKSAINDNLYIQQTTGVLPEDFTKLFQTASERLGSSKEKASNIVSEMLKASLTIAGGTLELAGELPETFKKHQKAAEGYLAYIAQYLMADTISLMKFIGQGSTEKNLFAFLPRASLAQSFTALPEALQKETKTWLALIDPFMKLAGNYGTAYWEKKIARDEKKETSEVFKEGLMIEESKSEEEAKETPVDPNLRTNTREVLTALFSGKDPKESFQRPLPELDTPHPNVEKATGQKS
ncbi:MAG: DUF4157 domain-containing protein, partial [Sinomicrobium sp.]|nr:DUF4157 domain-containing protein [Sinomicrobium sp.]